MMTGHAIKAGSQTFELFWPLAGKQGDDALAREAAQWITKNERVLAKLTPPECCKQVSEQFPQLAIIEVRGSHGRLGRLAK